MTETIAVKVGDHFFPYNIISDTEIHVSIPEQLPPGSYPVLAYCVDPRNISFGCCDVINKMSPPMYIVPE